MTEQNRTEEQTRTGHRIGQKSRLGQITITRTEQNRTEQQTRTVTEQNTITPTECTTAHTQHDYMPLQ